MSLGRAGVITVSDRSAAGTRVDVSGPELARLLHEAGFEVVTQTVVGDEVSQVQAAVQGCVAQGCDLVLTTGGTGLGPRDVTPEATRSLLEREAPGVVEALRAFRRDELPAAMLSRGVAGTVGRTLVVNLPGSPSGVRDALTVLAPVLPHAVAQLRGGDH